MNWNRIDNKIDYVVEILSKNLTWEDACELESLLIVEYGRIDNKTGKLLKTMEFGGNITRESDKPIKYGYGGSMSYKDFKKKYKDL